MHEYIQTRIHAFFTPIVSQGATQVLNSTHAHQDTNSIHTHAYMLSSRVSQGATQVLKPTHALPDMNSCNGRTIVSAMDCDLIFCCVVRCCKVRAETYCFTVDAIWRLFGPPTIREFATLPPPSQATHDIPSFTQQIYRATYSFPVGNVLCQNNGFCVAKHLCQPILKVIACLLDICHSARIGQHLYSSRSTGTGFVKMFVCLNRLMEEIPFPGGQ
jgi:hypothetical protein